MWEFFTAVAKLLAGLIPGSKPEPKQPSDAGVIDAEDEARKELEAKFPDQK